MEGAPEIVKSPVSAASRHPSRCHLPADGGDRCRGSVLPAFPLLVALGALGLDPAAAIRFHSATV